MNVTPALSAKCDRVVAMMQVLEPLYRTSSMAWFITLAVALALVNMRLLTPRVTSPEKVVAGREVGVTVSQVLYLLL